MAVSSIDKAIKSVDKLRKKMADLNGNIEFGSEALRNMSKFIEERDQVLRESVTEEDVLDFMERSMLPYEEAKTILQDARAAWPWEGEEIDEDR